jgi:non-ribosomal peptide synthetase component E (peptide arylation enzyme)
MNVLFGKAAFNHQVRVIDDEGQDVEPGDVGEIVVFGPGIMKGYYKKPNETAQVYTPELGDVDIKEEKEDRKKQSKQ